MVSSQLFKLPLTENITTAMVMERSKLKLLETLLFMLLEVKHLVNILKLHMDKESMPQQLDQAVISNFKLLILSLEFGPLNTDSLKLLRVLKVISLVWEVFHQDQATEEV